MVWRSNSYARRGRPHEQDDFVDSECKCLGLHVGCQLLFAAYHPTIHRTESKNDLKWDLCFDHPRARLGRNHLEFYPLIHGSFRRLLGSSQWVGAKQKWQAHFQWHWVLILCKLPWKFSLVIPYWILEHLWIRLRLVRHGPHVYYKSLHLVPIAQKRGRLDRIFRTQSWLLIICFMAHIFLDYQYCVRSYGIGLERHQ